MSGGDWVPLQQQDSGGGDGRPVGRVFGTLLVLAFLACLLAVLFL